MVTDPGLYDNTQLERREMWLRGLRGQVVFHGWCHVSALAHTGKEWDPGYPFGYFPYPK